MIKVYKTGVNVCIENYTPELPIYFIPTHQTRFDVTENSVIITDVFPNKLDRFLIPLVSLTDDSTNVFSTILEAQNYLSAFIGQSFGGGSSSLDNLDLPKWNQYNLVKSTSGTDTIETYVFKYATNNVATVVITTESNGDQTATKTIL